MREKKHTISIAVLGGGVTGLTVAYYLSKRFKTTVFEAKPFFGGLAAGYKEKNWKWFLEYAYHHIFASDKDILNFSNEVGYKNFVFYTPQTDSLFEHDKKLKIFPMDNPIDYLRIPTISTINKLRSAAVLGWFKATPFFNLYNSVTTEGFLKKTMGNEVWFKLWEPLFRKKFGKYAGNILTAFFWARIHTRTQKLGYPNGGFQDFINHVCSKIQGNGGILLSSEPVFRIEKDNTQFNIYTQTNKLSYSHIVSTIPSPILIKIDKNTLLQGYKKKLGCLQYLSALSLISRSKSKLLPKTYWLNIGVRDMPLMGIIQHTNIVDAKHYNNEEIAYIPYYLEKDDPKLSMSVHNLAHFVSPYLKMINPQFNILQTDLSLFKESYAQPVYDRNFIKNIPTIQTPTKKFFIANLDMTYPYDRGTNYAIRLGRRAVEEVLKNISSC